MRPVVRLDTAMVKLIETKVWQDEARVRLEEAMEA